MRNDDWFKHRIGIRQIPSSSRLRQRFYEGNCALIPLINDALVEAVVNLTAPVIVFPSRLDKHRHIALDIDVSRMNNSGIKKENIFLGFAC